MRLTVEVRKQGDTYARERGAAYVALCNGNEWQFWRRSGESLTQVADLPHYDKVTAGRIEFETVEELPPEPREPFGAKGSKWELFVEARKRNFAFEENYWLPAIRLQDGLECAFPDGGLSLVDLGLRNVTATGRSYRGADTASGKLDGWYRAFAAVTVDGRTWELGVYLRPSDTRLCIGLVQDTKFRAILSTKFSVICRVESGKARFSHDGRMTRAKYKPDKEELFALLRAKAPSLIAEDGRVEFGTLDLDRNATDEEMRTFIGRLLAYVLLRAEYKLRIEAEYKGVPQRRSPSKNRKGATTRSRARMVSSRDDPGGRRKQD